MIPAPQMMDASCLLDPPAMVAAFGRPSAVVCGQFRVRPVVEAWELRGHLRLRRAVFCREQQLFPIDDRDEHDASAHAIVAVSTGVLADGDVVGTVRIHEASPRIWFGSRLAIDVDWRGVPNLAATLIRAAVGAACDRGCLRFMANVQRQNVPLFRRLRWQTLGDVTICGKPHQLMQADLTESAPASAHHPPARLFATGTESAATRAV